MISAHVSNNFVQAIRTELDDRTTRIESAIAQIVCRIAEVNHIGTFRARPPVVACWRDQKANRLNWIRVHNPCFRLQTRDYWRRTLSYLRFRPRALLRNAKRASLLSQLHSAMVSLERAS